MEIEIVIDGRPVRFRATAAVPRLYRIKFGRDIMQDMVKIQEMMEKIKKMEGSFLPNEVLELFENMAYIMAKHADKDGVQDNVEDWMEQFGTFSVYQIFPQLAELWCKNMQTTSTVQKKKKYKTVK